jgi:hypothetical protein
MQFHALRISICVMQALERNEMAAHQCPEEEKIKQYCIFSISNDHSDNTVQLFIMIVHTFGL